MASYYIPRMFTLTREDGSARFFPPGLISLPDDDIDTKHWYFLASVRPPDEATDDVALPADVEKARQIFARGEAVRAAQRRSDPRFIATMERAKAMGERAYQGALNEERIRQAEARSQAAALEDESACVADLEVRRGRAPRAS